MTTVELYGTEVVPRVRELLAGQEAPGSDRLTAGEEILLA